MENVQTMGGLYESNAQTEGQCKSGCANDELCDGVDWSDSQQACWFIFVHRRTHQPIQHWEIIRNLPINCSESKRTVELCFYEASNAPIFLISFGNATDLCLMGGGSNGIYSRRASEVKVIYKENLTGQFQKDVC